jgi:iron(III) transport system substrate-binding protein
VILFNKKLVKQNEIPKSIYDFINPKWNGRCAIANPLFGTTTFHAAAIFTLLGDEKARELFKKMKDNNVVIATSNGDVRKRVADGEVVFGLVDTDDANEAMKDSQAVAMIFPDADQFGTLLIPNTLSLIAGSPNQTNGKKLIDYLLTKEVEAKLAESCAQLPMLPQPLRMPDAFNGSTIVPMKIDYGQVASVMERIQPYFKEWIK